MGQLLFVSGRDHTDFISSWGNLCLSLPGITQTSLVHGATYVYLWQGSHRLHLLMGQLMFISGGDHTDFICSWDNLCLSLAGITQTSLAHGATYVYLWQGSHRLH
ncbi:hypothetical protein BsWGS_02567 [Bradybaena similaris]